jgi:hypothetical protein
MLGLLAVVLALSVTFWIGCSDRGNLSTEPVAQQPGVQLTVENPAIKQIMAVQDRHTSDLMKDPNVVGVGTTLTDDGRLAILVFLNESTVRDAKGRSVSAASTIPTVLEGVPVITEVSGPFRAMSAPPPKSNPTAVSHTAKQTPPIQLGTSGGWRYDIANGYCCSGTLGSLITFGGVQYILSNYHVFWGDGGKLGDTVIQPGLVDVSCNPAGAQNVAHLSGTGSLPAANVDVGYAQVISGMVSTTGSILEIGTISNTTVAASVKQAVKKSGRTTGLSRSTIKALNLTVSVAYESSCAGKTAFTKTFTGQIDITNTRETFLNSGDSGSLMVEDVTTNPRAVGLLYAGSSTDAVANPIGAVLSWVGNGATMVGQ